MKRRINHAGFGHLAAVGIVLFLLVAGFTGYKVVMMNHAVSVAPAAKTTAASSAPASINSKADLTQASKALDNSNTQVNSSLNDSALDSDLNDML